VVKALGQGSRARPASRSAARLSTSPSVNSTSVAPGWQHARPLHGRSRRGRCLGRDHVLAALQHEGRDTDAGQVGPVVEIIALTEWPTNTTSESPISRPISTTSEA
jgi:hypothetical protein